MNKIKLTNKISGNTTSWTRNFESVQDFTEIFFEFYEEITFCTAVTVVYPCGHHYEIQPDWDSPAFNRVSIIDCGVNKEKTSFKIKGHAPLTVENLTVTTYCESYLQLLEEIFGVTDMKVVIHTPVNGSHHE